MGSAYYDAHSLWQRSETPLFHLLNENLKVDTCIVGAGIAGLTTAYQLLKIGQRVAVLDRERVGLGETGLTSAHLSNALDEGYAALQKLHGHEGARLAAESHTYAIDLIERIQNEEQIACDFRRLDGYLFAGEKGSVTTLNQEMEAAHLAGLSHVRLLEDAPSKLFATGPCLLFPNQATFHPLLYLDGLAQAVEELGGKIFTHSEVSEVHGGRNAFVKTTRGCKVECDSIVVTTNVPFNGGLTIHSKNAAYRSYVIGLAIPPETHDEALYWDTSEPYHYLNFVKDPTKGDEILLVGGGDHRTGQDSDPEEQFSLLRRWTEQRLEIEARVVSRWSGQIVEPVDGLAYIGQNPSDHENVYILTGDSGHGLTHGTLGATLLRDLILKRENPWAKLYDPSRLHLRSLPTFAKEAAHSAAPYADWLADGDVTSINQIANGEGAVIREGLRRVAVFKDGSGRAHACSAVCTHLGGIVRWNSAEKTWDCPCHGSRFDRFGKVVNGPAQHELAPVLSPLEPSAQTITI